MLIPPILCLRGGHAHTPRLTLPTAAFIRSAAEQESVQLRLNQPRASSSLGVEAIAAKGSAAAADGCAGNGGPPCRKAVGNE